MGTWTNGYVIVVQLVCCERTGQDRMLTFVLYAVVFLYSVSEGIVCDTSRFPCVTVCCCAAAGHFVR